MFRETRATHGIKTIKTMNIARNDVIIPALNTKNASRKMPIPSATANA